MPLTPFTLEDAKRRFVMPHLAAFSRMESATRSASMNRLLLQINSPAQAKPFNGKYPTRVIVFGLESRFASPTIFYFGKRTTPLTVQRIRAWHPNPTWLEFDRENVVCFIDFVTNSRYLSYNLATHYYRGGACLASYNYIAKVQARLEFEGAGTAIGHFRYRLWDPPAMDEPEEDYDEEPERGELPE